jgi:hypothetical protein
MKKFTAFENPLESGKVFFVVWLIMLIIKKKLIGGILRKNKTKHVENVMTLNQSSEYSKK